MAIYPKFGFPAPAARGSMRRKRFIYRALVALRPRGQALLLAPLLIQAMLFAAPSNECKVSDYGRSGDQLPILVVDAIHAVRTLPALVFEDTLNVGPNEVVLVDDLQKWFRCWGISDVRKQSEVRQRVAFSIPPNREIFFNGEINGTILAIKHYAGKQYAGKVEHLPFVLAHIIVHEAVHVAGEADELQPLIRELEAILLFEARGQTALANDQREISKLIQDNLLERDR